MADPNKKIVVTYSSINGNGFGGYGEVVMGTQGTLILEQEQDVMLYKDSARDTRVTVATGKDGAPRARHDRKRRRAAAGGGRDRRLARPRPPVATPRRWSTGPGASATRPRKTSPAASRRWRWPTR